MTHTIGVVEREREPNIRELFCQHTKVMLFSLKLIKNLYMMSQSFQLITDFIHSIIENTKKMFIIQEGLSRISRMSRGYYII